MKVEQRDPCINCNCCHGYQVARDEQGEPLHVGSQIIPNWEIDLVRECFTRDGRPLVIKIAKSNKDREILLKNWNEIFPDTDSTLGVIDQYTRKANEAYPYICFASIKGRAVGKLFLERNSNNSMRRELQAAIIDNVQVDINHEGNGICTEMLAFVEELARKNKIAWLEIGARRVEDNEDQGHLRRGLDSLRIYIKRGYTKHPVIPTRSLLIHNLISIDKKSRSAAWLKNSPQQNQDNISFTITHPRYDSRSLVVYKNLLEQDENVMDQQTVLALFRELTADVPQIDDTTTN